MRRSNAKKAVITPDPTSQDDAVEAPAMDSSQIKLQSRPNRRSPQKLQLQKSNLLRYIWVFIFLIILCCILVFHKNRSNFNEDGNFVGRKRFGIVIDGGSTGTRIHVFTYEEMEDDIDDTNGKRKRVKLDFSERGLVSMKVNPGLSAYAKEPERVGLAVKELLEFGKGKVPRQYWEETEIRLMATAGMRLLKKDDQEKILKVCRRALSTSGFKFQDDWASVISGSDEGVYAWVVANYALGTLGGDPQQTTGIIELGGASAQVTFVSDEAMPPEYSRETRYGNFTYNLYSHSLLHFGQNVAFDLLRDSFISGGQEVGTASPRRGKPVDPCTPRGYIHDEEPLKLSPSSLTDKSRYLSSVLPNGNYSECRSASLTLLQRDKERCSYQNCLIGSTFTPKLQGKFLATENFFHTSKFFGLSPKAFLSNMIIAGQQFCEEDWGTLKKKYHSLEEDDLLHYCFSSAYIVALLHDSLGISLDDERIGYANQVQNIPLDWALGAFILQIAATSNIENLRVIGNSEHGNFTSFLVFFGIALSVLSVAWTVSKWKKPQLKTIYDLEKGKYIVTHVSRYS